MYGLQRTADQFAKAHARLALFEPLPAPHDALQRGAFTISCKATV